MSFHVVSTIFRKELLDTLRDKRNLIAMLGVPILLYPAIFIFAAQMASLEQDRLDRRVSRIAVVGDSSGIVREWLEETGNLNGYIAKLSSAFNPCAIEGLMCRKLFSVSWDGFLYDCDFNLARELPFGGLRIHVSEMQDSPKEGSPISVSDHCFTCTAGTGFT